MTEADNKGRPGPRERGFAPLLIHREQTGNTAETLHPKISAIAVIRPPMGIGQEDMRAFYMRLLQAGVLPITLPTEEESHDDTYRYFPTDQYREVGGEIFVTHPHRINELFSFIEAHEEIKPFLADLKTRKKAVGTFFAGANYVYDERSKILIYDETEVNHDEGQSNLAMTDNALDSLKDDGWNVIPFVLNNRTVGEIMQDFDFIASSPYKGKRGETYMFIAQPFLEAFSNNDALRQTGIHLLPVPEEEVLKGGCNIADLNGSKILVCANREDAPTVFSQLTELADAKIIETPRGFLDGNGGPRCSISSISIKQTH